MALTALHPLDEVKWELNRIADTGDAQGLANVLRGLGLPSLGGGASPAEVILEALSRPPFDTPLRRELAELAAPLMDALSGAPVSDSPLFRESYVRSLFHLVAYLPANASLFNAVHRFYEAGSKLFVALSGQIRAEREVRNALIHQQTDDRLEEKWLAAILSKADREQSQPFNHEELNEVSDAWAGLLWIPPTTPEAIEAEETLNVSRIERGLLALAKAFGQHIEEGDMLAFAIGDLSQLYPRSPVEWKAALGGRVIHWPALLRAAALAQWPFLSAVLIPEEALPVWNCLYPEQQTVILGGDQGAARRMLEDLMFSPPHRSDVPKKMAIHQLKVILDAIAPVSIQAHPNLSEMKAEDARAEHKHKPKETVLQGGTRDGFSRVNKVMVEVKRQISAGRPQQAVNFVRDLVQTQKDEGAGHELISKTLTKAGTLFVDRNRDMAASLFEQARDENPDDPVPLSALANLRHLEGDLDTAETLYRETMTRWPDDVFAHTGMAEVTKARGDLDTAEILYRETMTRWPDNVFAHTGMAEVAKARGDLDTAETLYRETMTRWPDNVVARTGMAEVAKARGDLDTAETLYRETVAKRPDDRVAAHGLANLLKKKRRFNEALVLVSEPVNASGTQAQFDLHLIGMIRLAMNQSVEALRVFEKGLAAAPSVKQVRIFSMAKATAELRQKQYENALADIVEIADINIGAAILRVHAFGGLGWEADMRTAVAFFEGKILTPTEQKTRDLLTRVFGLNDNFRQPTEEEAQELAELEIEMQELPIAA